MQNTSIKTGNCFVAEAVLMLVFLIHDDRKFAERPFYC